MNERVARVRGAGSPSRYDAGIVASMDWIKAHHTRVMAAEAKRPSHVTGTRREAVLNAENRIICAGLEVTDAMKDALIGAVSTVARNGNATQIVNDWFALHMDVVRASAARLSSLAK